jgi:hypothetical protein
MVPDRAVEITGELASRWDAEQVVYFHGQLPVLTNAKNDVACFRMFTRLGRPPAAKSAHPS